MCSVQVFQLNAFLDFAFADDCLLSAHCRISGSHAPSVEMFTNALSVFFGILGIMLIFYFSKGWENPENSDFFNWLSSRLEMSFDSSILVLGLLSESRLIAMAS